MNLAGHASDEFVRGGAGAPQEQAMSLSGVRDATGRAWATSLAGHARDEFGRNCSTLALFVSKIGPLVPGHFGRRCYQLVARRLELPALRSRSRRWPGDESFCSAASSIDVTAFCGALAGRTHGGRFQFHESLAGADSGME
jgi:hypothetical protein